MRKVLILIFVGMAVLAKSQNRQKTILLLSDSLVLDSQIIVHHSVIVSNGNKIYFENIDFRINYSNQSANHSLLLFINWLTNKGKKFQL